MLNDSDKLLSPAQRRIHTAAIDLFARLGVTKVSVSELAAAAGVARGTIYNNIPDTEGLFEEVAAQLIIDISERVKASFGEVEDPAHQMAMGVRQYIRRAHEDPASGRFMNRFGFSNSTIQGLWSAEPMANLQAGIESGRYRITTRQLPSVLGLIAGATLAAMLPVLEGHGTWRDIGSDTAELVLLALGVPRDQASELARSELPPLPTLLSQ